MDRSIFLQVDFFALIIFSGVLPISLYVYMLWTQSISRWRVLMFGLCLIGMAGLDVLLLQRLTGIARRLLSLADDQFLLSEFSVSLYVLPALLAGVGVNIVSHVLLRHLTEAERKFDRDHR